MRRALFVSTMSGVPWGGSERLWTAAARAALTAGWHVTISTRAWPETPRHLAELVAAGARWLAFPSPEDASANGGPEAYTPLLGAGLDVACISQGSTYDFLGFDAFCSSLYRCGVPYVVLCRLNEDAADLTDEQQRSGRRFFSAARRVGFAARRNITSAERQLGMGLPHATVIQSPINLPELAPLPWPSTDVPSFACVARLDLAYKGHDLLLDCLSSPAWAARPWQLGLYGEGPDAPIVQATIVRNGLNGRVTIEGHADNLVEIWRRTHLLLLPSRSEGTPQALIESMICGRPSVCTDVGGVTEWVQDGESGFIAERASQAALADALERAWQHRDAWPGIGQRASRVAIEKVDRFPAQRLLDVLATMA